MSEKVAIIGAGWSGLAAAIALSEQQIPVVIFEASRLAGGRARSVSLDGLALDNGQHIMLAAYQKCLQLITKVGGDPELLFFRQALRYLDVSGFDLDFSRYSWLSPQLQRLLVLVINRQISWREKYVLINALHRLERAQWRTFTQQNDCSVADWLAANPMPFLTQHFWLPLCLAALNTPLEKASMRVFANVLRDSMGSKGRGAIDVLVPRYPLGEIFPDLAVKYLQNKNVTFHWQTRIKNVQLGQQFTINQEKFSHLIVATAPQHLSSIIDIPVNYAYQPIATLYLTYSEDISLPSAMISMQGCSEYPSAIGQWLIARPQPVANADLTARQKTQTQSYPRHQPIQSTTLAIVLSGEGKWQNLDNRQLCAQLLVELQRLAINQRIPLSNQTRNILSTAPLKQQLIREARATFSCDSGLVRLNQQVSENCYLAGDHCWSEYPGTLEGAVRSGTRAAEMVGQTLNNKLSLEKTFI